VKLFLSILTYMIAVPLPERHTWTDGRTDR